LVSNYATVRFFIRLFLIILLLLFPIIFISSKVENAYVEEMRAQGRKMMNEGMGIIYMALFFFFLYTIPFIGWLLTLAFMKKRFQNYHYFAPQLIGIGLLAVLPTAFLEFAFIMRMF